MSILISQGHIVDPANEIDRVADLYVVDGKIAALDEAPASFNAEHTIDAKGKLVLPGLVDLCARLGEPGFEHKADMDSECRAAVSAGVTTLCCPPDTIPPLQSAADIEFIEQRQQEVGLSKIHVIGALTQGLKGEQLSEMAALKEAGCVGLTNGLHPFSNANVIRRSMEYARGLDLTVHIYPQDPDLSEGGCVHEGPVSTRLGLTGIPEAAETAAIGFYLPLIEQCGVRAHFCHISTAKGMNMIRRAAHDGMNISADVCAHQLFLTEMDVSDFNSLCHTQPPLRSIRDRDMLRNALTEGGLQAITSDHHPHDRDAKLAPFPHTEPGVSAIETLLSLVLRLVEEKVVTLSQAIALVTCNPAQILGIPAGTLTPGQSADVCIVDESREWICDPEKLISRGKNTAFSGWHFSGKVSCTMIDGRMIYQG